MASACIYMECPITHQILAVSRKDDYYDMGLPGGKVEPGQTEEEAARAELLQETGILLYPNFGATCKLEEIFRREGGVTFRAQTSYIHVIVARGKGETGRVAWVEPDALIRGSFGAYNERLLRHIGRIR